ncbi:MAG: hypothetical protein F6K26_18880 [Moorea sp. SIO2I5]|nr:hypothetical protein [Moorena sp. SIO2I5]
MLPFYLSFFKLSAISYQLKRYAHATRTAISYQLSVISYQLSVISLCATHTLREQLLNKTGKHWFNLCYLSCSRRE